METWRFLYKSSGHTGRWRLTSCATRRICAAAHRFASGDVATGRPEALGERSHEDVDVLGVEAEVVDDAATSGPHGAYL